MTRGWRWRARERWVGGVLPPYFPDACNARKRPRPAGCGEVWGRRAGTPHPYQRLISLYAPLRAMYNLKRLTLIGPADFVEKWEKEIRLKGFPEKSLLVVKNAERMRA